MKSFVFVIHHQCSYRDGMIIVNANDFNHADEILKNTKQSHLVRHGEADVTSNWANEPLLDKDDKVLDNYPTTIPRKERYDNIWCLYHTMLLKPGDTEGIKAVAFHDG
jgi:hypothetical protein